MGEGEAVLAGATSRAQHRLPSRPLPLRNEHGFLRTLDARSATTQTIINLHWSIFFCEAIKRADNLIYRFFASEEVLNLF